MSESSKDNHIGLLLKDLLKKKSLSMRKFGELTEIDTATISRIINGKRKATLDHLQKFSESLNVPLDILLIAAGYLQEQKQKKVFSKEINESIEYIQYFLETSNQLNKKFSIENVKSELAMYEQFSQTEEGKETILNGFEDKVKKLGSVGPFISKLQQMYKKFCTLEATPPQLAVLGSALLYFILPVDVIPDYILPVGYLDDGIAVQLVLGGFTKKLQGKNGSDDCGFE